MATYFFIALGVMVVGIIGAILNVVFAYDSTNLGKSLFVRHALFGILYVLGGLAALIIGIVWIVQQFTS